MKKNTDQMMINMFDNGNSNSNSNRYKQQQDMSNKLSFVLEKQLR